MTPGRRGEGARIAVHSTAYPGSLRFANAWYESVVHQTDRAFDLWISLDGVSRDDVARAAGAMPSATWLEPAPGTPPSLIRQEALERMVGRYDYVIPMDADDLFLPSRIEAARRGLETADIAACALAVIDEDGRDLGITFGPPAGTDPVAALPVHNVFGFSNSAWRADVLQRCLPIPADCVLFDWLLATRAWSLGAKLCFDGVPRMRYRQYRSNTAAVLTPFTGDQIRVATGRVLAHYALVLGDAWPLAEPVRLRVAAARDRCLVFAAAMDDPVRLDRYVGALNRLPPRFVWWWSVANPELEELWTS